MFFSVFFYHLCPRFKRPTTHNKDPPGSNIKGARTWGPSTYHQRERGALVEFPAQPKCAAEQAAFSKSAPNLDKSKLSSSTLSPLPKRMQRMVGSSATSLGKSHDEGLNRIKGKKLPPSQYHRGHTTNLCGDHSSSSPFKITLSDSAGFSPSSSSSLVLRRGQGRTDPGGSSSSSSFAALPEKEDVGCFGLIRGGSGGGGSNGARVSARHHKKFSLDNTGSGEAQSDVVTYDIAFYRKMQKSVDELFDERRFASDESFAASSQGSSEFRRECFFNKSAPEHESSLGGGGGGLKSKSRSGSLPKGGGNDKFQYLSLNDLLGTTTTTMTENHMGTSDLVDLYGDQSLNSAQYSHSSSSSSQTTTSASTSSRKNSQVSFDEGNKAKPAPAGGSVKLPPMKSEVSPRKFEKIYNLGTVDGSNTAPNNLRFGTAPATIVTGKGGTQTKQRQKTGFITSLFKKGHRSVEKRTAKRGSDGRDEKINLVADDNNELEEEETSNSNRVQHGLRGGERRGSSVRDGTSYDMIYTKRHIIAKQTADPSLFRSDSQ